MPVYIYQHPKTGKIVEIVQRMTEAHEYSENGVQFSRIFQAPGASVDTRMNPFSEADFVRRTNKRMTLGDMMDESKALSEKRAQKAGKDPIREKAITDYEKLTKKQHPSKLKGQRFENKYAVIET
jgi:hypothetical protein